MQLTSEHLFCWSATQLTRLPLDGAPGTTVNQSPLSLVETGAGVAFTVTAPDLVLTGSTWRQVMAWRSDQSAGLAAVNGFQHLTGPLAPVIGGTISPWRRRTGMRWRRGFTGSPAGSP